MFVIIATCRDRMKTKIIYAIFACKLTMLKTSILKMQMQIINQSMVSQIYYFVINVRALLR